MSFMAPKLFDEIVATIYKEYLCSIDAKYGVELDVRQLSSGLRREFENVCRPSSLTAMAKVRVVSAGHSWEVDDGDTRFFIRNEIRNEKQTLGWYLKRNTIVGENATETITPRILGKLQDMKMASREENGADRALVRLFGRLTELISDRLDQVPDKHFLSFLDHAGVDLLPPRPAEIELTFDLELKPDATDDFVLAPKGTRVATVATESRPEIVFETQEDLTVVANELVKCITFDPINHADRTSLVTNVEARPFRVFEGTERRERVLYLAADKLLDFTDDASRLNATITLTFTLADNLAENSMQNVHPVEIEVRYWNGIEWQRIAEVCVEDNTQGFSYSGTVVIGNRPLFHVDAASFSSELDRGELSEALRAQFTAEGRPLTAAAKVAIQEPKNNQPIDDSGVKYLDREWSIDDAGLKYILRNEKHNEKQALAVYNIPLMAKTTVGGPQILDGFLFSIDARPYMDLDPDQFKKELKEALCKTAQYHRVDLKEPLTIGVQPGDAKTPIWELKDSAGTILNAVQQEMKFNVSFPQEPQTWIALALTGFDEPREFPAISGIKAERAISRITCQQTTGDTAFSGMPANDAFVPLTLTDEFFPLGQRPAPPDAFYLNSNEAFSKPGAVVQIDFEGFAGVPEDAESDRLKAVEVVWEYFSTEGWTRLGSSKRRREYLFSVGSEYGAELDKRKVTTIRKEFDQNDCAFVTRKPEVPEVQVIESEKLWRIVDGAHTYAVRKQDETLKVYRLPDKEIPRKTAEEDRVADIVCFSDTTAAFTATKVEVDGLWPCVNFTVPSGGTGKPFFKQTTVNDVPGYWIRARLVDGGFDVLPEIPSPRLFRRRVPQLAQFFAPRVKRLKVYYTYDPAKVPAEKLQCLSVVDNMLRVHTSALKAGRPFYPFSAKTEEGPVSAKAEEGPAMYIGWQKSFPGGKRIDLLIDAREQESEVKSSLVWEYWSGRGWKSLLEIVDKSQSLTRRGPIGFTAPPDFRTTRADRSISETDHRLSTEFGENAFWFRIRPGRSQQPLKVSLVEDGVSAVTLTRVGEEWIVELDSLAPSVKVVLEDVAPKDPAPNDETNGAICTRPSTYVWNIVPSGDFKRLILNSIRLNNVKAQNTTTFLETIIGSSDGTKDQVFMFPGKPLLLDAEIAVREPDSLSKSELQTLRQELKDEDPNAEALVDPDAEMIPGQGRWVRWHCVESFRNSKDTSRHFFLNRVDGKVIFGDGKYGRIPPAGRNNIKALRYRTQNGAAGIVESGVVTVMRNPKDALANIRSVTNLESSVGGSDAQSVADVKQSGPQSLRHRHQTVTAGGFKLLAESTTEIRRAYPMPARNPRGVEEPGWMTVIVVPGVPDDKPFPKPEQMRFVTERLEKMAATSLYDAKGKPVSHIHVRGPEYVRIDVNACIWVKPRENPDEVCKRVKRRLAEFLHPLRGGTDRGNQQGWEFGRDVFLSEVLAEIENESKVDRVKSATLYGSIDQLYVSVTKYQDRLIAVPPSSIISTFDNRLRMVVADPPKLEQARDQWALPLFGFKENDKVALVSVHDGLIIDELEIVALSSESDCKLDCGIITLRAPLDWPKTEALIKALKESDGLLARDARVRLPLYAKWKKDLQSEVHLGRDSHNNIKIYVQKLLPNDEISVWEEGRQEPIVVSVVKEVKQPEDRVFVPEGGLVYPGNFNITSAGFR